MTAQGPLVTGVESVPLWIGSSDRPLFAWLDLPDDGLVVGTAVVCPSMGLEAAYSTRAFRDLAHRLARARWAALRFDYAATGDSVGSWTDPGLVAEWLGNVRLAIDFARGLGAARVGVVGMRLGATLAAAELARGEPVDDVVLWDPCASGRSFLREQRALAAFRRELEVEWGMRAEDPAPTALEANPDGLVEAPGAVFSSATAGDLGALAIARDDGVLASRELVLPREGRRPERAIAARLSMPHVESLEITGQEALFGERPVTPVPTLERIVSWFSEPGGPLGRVARPEGPPAAVHRALDRPGVRERAVVLGPLGLFGMVSEPEHELTASAPTVLFLNAGVINHQGPGRLWVELARACAAGAAVRCLRVDLNGIGESPTRPGGTELRNFPDGANLDMEDIRSALTVDGSKLMLLGVCSGADHAMEMALAAPVASLWVINPALSFLQWGEDEEAAAVAERAEEDRQTWGASGALLSRAMARLERFRGLTRWIPTPGWWFVKRWLMTSSPGRTLERLVHSGVHVVVVVGGGEARRVYRGEQHRLHGLVAGGGLHIETVPDLDHSLLERTSHDRVAGLFVSAVERWAAEPSGLPLPS